MNILVIEDEPPILRDIIAIIESFHEDYQITGRAANGQEAMDFLQKNGKEIDVMITDIQIPVISGLEIIRYTHENLPHILCIILTGFSNFDYARTAIKYGVFDYLLKPVDEEELHAQLQKAYIQKCLDYMQNHSKIPETTPSGTDTGYQIALLSLGSFPAYSALYNELFPELWKKLNMEGILERHKELRAHYWIIDGISLAEKIILFLIPEEFQQNPKSYLSSVFAPVLNAGMTITIVADTRFSGIRTIHQSILNLRNYTNKKVRLEKTQLLFFSEKEAEPPEEDLSVFRSYCLRLSNLFSQKKIAVFEAELKAYLNEMRRLNLPAMTIYRLLQDLLHSCVQAADEAPEVANIDIPFSVGDILMLSDTYAALYKNLHSVFLSFFEAIIKEDKILKDRANTLLKVDAYMREHFTLPINTKSIANLFGFTPAYLSQIFREYKSITPADYIIQLRIEKAQELLRENPGCKIKDVAIYVGYEDSLYFSKVFKKITGMSPKQFIEKETK